MILGEPLDGCALSPSPSHQHSPAVLQLLLKMIIFLFYFARLLLQLPELLVAGATFVFVLSGFSPSIIRCVEFMDEVTICITRGMQSKSSLHFLRFRGGVTAARTGFAVCLRG